MKSYLLHVIVPNSVKKTLVISNADDDVADNFHPFLPVILPFTGVCKSFQYDSRNFRYAFITPPISNFLNSTSKFPHNPFDHRGSSWKDQSPFQPAANITEHTDFCPSHIGCRRLIPMSLQISDQLINGSFCFLHSFLDIVFFLFRYLLKIFLGQFDRQRSDQSLLNWFGIHLASTILIHCVIQIPIDMPVATLLFRSIFGKCFGQSKFTITDQNTAIRKLHSLFFPLLADSIPTCSSPTSKRKYFSTGGNPDNHLQIAFTCLAITTCSFESGSVWHNLNRGSSDHSF